MRRLGECSRKSASSTVRSSSDTTAVGSDTDGLKRSCPPARSPAAPLADSTDNSVDGSVRLRLAAVDGAPITARKPVKF